MRGNKEVPAASCCDQVLLVVRSRHLFHQLSVFLKNSGIRSTDCPKLTCIPKSDNGNIYSLKIFGLSGSYLVKKSFFSMCCPCKLSWLQVTVIHEVLAKLNCWRQISNSPAVFMRNIYGLTCVIKYFFTATSAEWMMERLGSVFKYNSVFYNQDCVWRFFQSPRVEMRKNRWEKEV